MKIFVAQAWSVLVQMALCAGTGARALPADMRMLSLVPPESQIVAGIVPTPKTRHQRSFVLFTVANTIDYEDFLSLAGADPSLQIDRLIFAAAAGASGGGAEHSVIVSGRFNPDRIYKSVGHSSGAQDYRGVSILLVRPFARERAYFQQDRLLAIMSSTLAIFGTPSSVREEIDRLLDGAVPDPALVQELSFLSDEDDSWYLVRSPDRRAEFKSALKNLDSALGEVGSAEGLLFGIRYGREVEFEYVSSSVPNPVGHAGLDAPVRRMFQDEGDEGRPAVHVVKVARGRFEKWLTQVAGH